MSVFGNRKKSIYLDYCAYSDKGGRDYNEDNVKTVKDGKRFIGMVADGLGGQGGGEIASKTATDVIAKEFKNSSIKVPDQFNIWYQAANQSVLSKQTQACQMMSTLATLYIDGNSAMWANVGDTRLYHFVKGRIVEQTFDHSVSQMAVLRGEITPEQIRGHADRNKLLRALGREDTIRIDYSEVVDLSKDNHTFLICTDGFWEYILEEEMEETLKGANSASDWVSRMSRIVKSREHKDSDNNTALVVIVGSK